MFVRVALLVLRKDIAIEVKSREILYTTLFFALSCVLVFSFALVRDGRAVWTRPTDPEILKTGRPDLLVYPAIMIGKGIAVSNGRQTADIDPDVVIQALELTEEKVLKNKYPIPAGVQIKEVNIPAPQYPDDFPVIEFYELRP